MRFILPVISTDHLNGINFVFVRVNVTHYRFFNNIYIKFDTKLYRRIVCIPMGINCAPLVADL